MEVRERVAAVLAGRMPDRVPFLAYSGFLQRGTFERRMRDMGVGLDLWCPVYKASMPNVKVETNVQGDYVTTTYVTPVGQSSMKTRTGMRFQLPGGTWVVDHLVKGVEDLEVVKYLVNDTVYEPDYDPYRQMEDELEGDGIVTVFSDYSPLMKTIISYMGFRNYALIFRRNPAAIEELMETIDRKHAEMYRIIASSPARIVRIGENMDSALVPPALFEKYCLPYYKKYVDLLKGNGKIAISHMDGRLRALKGLIARTPFDAIEAFTPPPNGDLPVGEAKEVWGEKIIWMNFPEEVFLRAPDEIRAFTQSLLQEMAPGKGYIISITEDTHPDHARKGLRIVAETLSEKGILPISQ